MEKFNAFLSIYDNFAVHLSKTNRLILAIAILLFIGWQLFLFVKKGRWIFLLILLFIIPASWPILKILLAYIWQIIKFLLIRIQVNI